MPDEEGEWKKMESGEKEMGIVLEKEVEVEIEIAMAQKMKKEKGLEGGGSLFR
jgi:hypothetical protein